MTQHSKSEVPLEPDKLLKTMSGVNTDKGFMLEIAQLLSRNIARSTRVAKLVEEQNLETKAATAEVRSVAESIRQRFNIAMGVSTLVVLLFGAFGVWIWTVADGLRTSHDEVTKSLHRENITLKAEARANRRLLRGQAVMLGRMAGAVSDFATTDEEGRLLKAMAAQVEVMAIEEEMRHEDSPELKDALVDAKLRAGSVKVFGPKH